MEVMEIFKNEMEKSVKLKATEEEYKQYLEILRKCRFEIDKNLEAKWELEEEDIRSELYDQAYEAASDAAYEEVKAEKLSEIDDLRSELGAAQEELTDKKTEIADMKLVVNDLETKVAQYADYEAELSRWKLKVKELENAIDTMEI